MEGIPIDKTKIITISIILVITGLMGSIVIGSKQSQGQDMTITPKSTEQATTKQNSKDIVFFYGNTCPHCADVEAWIIAEKIEEKITIIKKEVYDNQENSQELNQVAKDCGLPTDSIGVPLLSTEGKCIIGTPDITAYLIQKTTLPESSSSAERSTK